MSYSSTILAASPALFWKLEEASGTVAADASGNARDGVATNVTWAQASLMGDGSGTSITLNGTNADVTLTSAVWMDSTSFSCVMRYKHTTLSGNRNFTGRWASGSSNRPWLFKVATNKLALQIDNDGSNTAVGATTLVNGQTYTIGVIVNNTTIKLYLDGVEDVSVVHAGPVQTGAALRLGRASTSLSFGADQGFAFWTSALTATDMTNFHAAAIATGAVSGAGSLSLSGSAAAAAAIAATAALSLTGSGATRAAALATGALALSGTAGTEAPAEAAGAGSLSLSGTGGATGTQAAAATGSLTLSGSAVGTPPVVYPDLIAASSPTAYYRLGEALGTTAADSSGGGHPGTYSAFPHLGETGILVDNTAARFSTSTSDDVRVPFWSGLNLTTLSVEVWVKTVATSGPIAGRSGSNDAPYRIDLNGLGKPLVWIFDGTTDHSYAAATAINDNRWHHVVATLNGATNTLSIYIDGVLDYQTASAAVPDTAGTYGFVMGSTGDNDGSVGVVYFTGTLDEVALYPTALSASTVLAHFVATTAPASSSTGGLTLSGSGTAFENAGTGSLTLSGTAGGVGTACVVSAGALTISGTGSPTLSATATGVLTLSAVALALPVYRTDTSNFRNGRSRHGSATVTITRAVAAPPATLRLSLKYDKAAAYPTPTMVDGRPT